MTRIWKIIVLCVGVLLSIAIVLMANARLQCHRAEKMLTLVKTLVPGESSQRPLENLLGSDLLTRSSSCTPRECDYRFQVINTWLSQIHLATARGVSVEFHVEDGQIKRSIFSLTGEGGRPGIMVYRLSCTNCAQDGKTYSASFNVTGLGQPNYAVVRLARDATAEEISRAYEINLKPLCGLGRMPNGRELAPRVWESQPDYR